MALRLHLAWPMGHVKGIQLEYTSTLENSEQ